jgi:hypothetical protein
MFSHYFLFKAMGAKYKGDWDSSCTHLVCAFPNTPKFNQVDEAGSSNLKYCHLRGDTVNWPQFSRTMVKVGGGGGVKKRNDVFTPALANSFKSEKKK